MSALAPGRRIAVAVAAAVVAAFVVVLLASYRMRPTPAAVFLALGWASLVAAGWFLARSVSVLEGTETSWLADEERVGGRMLAELLREKRLLLKAIKEIEFDQAMGKLGDADAAAAIARYRTRALEIIAATGAAPDGEARAEVERELARRLATTAGGLTQGACGQCRAANEADAVFCKKCGARLAAREASA